MSWDPAQYGLFLDQRTRPAADLLAHIRLDAPARIADLGCGPGNSTALLAKRWPKAAITGIDSSQAMLEKARESAPDIDWQCADIAQWRADPPFALIYSNALLHWLDNHAVLFPRLLSSVAKGGALAVQMPRNFDAPSHRIIAAVAQSAPFRAKLSGRLREAPVADPDYYYQLLAADCHLIDMWETSYLHVLEGQDAVLNWIKGTALVPLLAALDAGEQNDFICELAARLAAAYPRHEDGKTLLPFKRLFFIAYR